MGASEDSSPPFLFFRRQQMDQNLDIFYRPPPVPDGPPEPRSSRHNGYGPAHRDDGYITCLVNEMFVLTRSWGVNDRAALGSPPAVPLLFATTAVYYSHLLKYDFPYFDFIYINNNAPLTDIKFKCTMYLGYNKQRRINQLLEFHLIWN